MARQRLGVVLLVPQPLATRIDGLRAGLGDGALGRIPAHLTLVPPINVTERDLPAVMAHVRGAGAGSRLLSLRLGPVTSFQPVTAAAYLAVGGEPDELDALRSLRSAVRSGPLDRPDEHEFVPHVTVADELNRARTAAAIAALADFESAAAFDVVHVLVEQPGRVWVPLADAPLGDRPRRIGQGGIPLELAVSGRPGPEAAALLAVDQSQPGLPFAVTARREGAVVAAAWGWSAGGALEVADLVVAAAHRGQGIGRHLLAGVEDLARRRSCTRAGATAPGGGAAASLLGACGWSIVSQPHAGSDDRRRWERPLAAPGSSKAGGPAEWP
jgi:2'-5' RNA ligase